MNNKEIFFKDQIVFFVKNYNEEESLVARSIGINVLPGILSIELKKISKESLWKFMRYAHKEYVNNIDNRDYLGEMFADIQKEYTKLYEHYKEIATKNFDKYSELMYHQDECCFASFYKPENIFALEQGLGKTLVGIATSEITKSKLTLIVMPAVVKYNWVAELYEWGVNMTEISVIDAEETRITPYERYILINYDLLNAWSERLKSKPIELIILDECHKVKNTDANRTKVVFDIQKISNSRLCLLSGTPAPNKVDDLFSYLCMTNNPLGQSKTEFTDRFTKTIILKNGEKKIIGDNLIMLNVALSNLIIRRKKDILNLPVKNYHKLIFELNEYEKEYDLAHEALIEAIKQKKGKGNFDLCLSQLNIISCKAKVRGIISLTETLVQKLKTVYVSDTFIEQDQIRVLTNKEIQVCSKVVIFCPFIEPLDILEKHFKDRCVRVDGRVPSKKRLKLAEKFRKSRKINVFLGQTDAAGIGINLINKEKEKDLPSITNVIHLGFPYTNAQLEQANDRTHRIGIYEEVEIYYTFAKGTIDDKIFRLVERKYNDVSVVIDGEKDIINFNETSLDELEAFRDAIAHDLEEVESLKDWI